MTLIHLPAMRLVRGWFGLAALCWLAWQLTPFAQAAEHYVGADTCRSCHDEPYDSFAASPHQALFESKEPSKQGCEACHGPGAEHVNSNGDPSKIFRFQEAPAETVRAHCGACHSTTTDTLHKQHSLSCLKCHSAHQYAEKKTLLIKTTPELCQTCHH